MKLLITTQTVNEDDANLGFFQEWIVELAKRAEHVFVVCLFEGAHHLPSNVTVISLRKEEGVAPTWLYAYRFYAALWRLRQQYDGVFVHMNPEYVVLAGLYWRLTRKKTLLWYVHKSVSLPLRISSFFVTKIFTASKESFRLPTSKLEVVGHGIVCSDFKDVSPATAAAPDPSMVCSLLSVGRISRAKDLETVLRAVAAVRQSQDMPRSVLRVLGAAITPSDEAYKKELYALDRELSGSDAPALSVVSVPHSRMPAEYFSSHILIHTSHTGSIDKVVLEALAAGRIVVTTSDAYRALAENELSGVLWYCPPGDYAAIANTIAKIWHSGILKELPNRVGMAYVSQNHSLNKLTEKIVDFFAHV